MSEVYQVRDTMLTGLPNLNAEGKRVPGTRAVGEKTILQPHELEGIDIDRLIRLGSIVKIETPEPEPAAEHLGADELMELTKAKVFDLGLKAGIDADDMKGLNKTKLVTKVIEAWDSVGQAAEAAEE